ncbi:hypothetical protein [Streptomyces sp. NPDC089799]|uniref:hypothetical protein n=1 Tax=Streptomyces sp. NPDC089799 TaxID=3155066 RepID=UPI00343C33A6
MVPPPPPAGWRPPPPPLPSPGVFLGSAFRILGRHWLRLMGALLLSQLAIFVLAGMTGFGIYALWGGPDPEGSAGPGYVTDMLLIVLVPALLAIFLVQGAVGSLASTLAQQDASGQRVTVRGLLRVSAPRVPGTVGGYLLTVFLFPCLLSPLAPLLAWPWVVYSLAPSVMARDGVGMFRALGRSAALIKGVWWPVFSTLALAALIAFGMDLTVGFLPLDAMVNRAADEPTGPTDASLSLGVIIAAVSVAFSVLMFQVAFAHLVADRLCEALRARHTTWPRPSGTAVP